MKINIITSLNGAGRERDAEIIKAILSDHDITISLHGRPISETADLHIFLEVVSNRVIGLPGKKILIPNPEWFRPEWKGYLAHFDAIFCKTNQAFDIFSNLHRNVIYCGFTSIDLMDESVTRFESSIIHFPGKSKTKGTDILRRDFKYEVNIFSHADRSVIVQKMNQYPIHLCPSIAEGWGHYIWEAFSVGAFVITTDCQPMNEQEFIGIKLPCKISRPHGLVPTFKTNSEEISKAIGQITPELIASARWANRALFLKNDGEFRKRFPQLINEI